MITHPKTEELVQSVALWIEQLRPSLDPRNAFLSRVAVNALGAVGRELANGPANDARAAELIGALLGHGGPLEDLNAELCAALRDGRLDETTPGLLPALHEIAMAQLAIDQPNYKPEGSL